MNLQWTRPETVLSRSALEAIAQVVRRKGLSHKCRALAVTCGAWASPARTLAEPQCHWTVSGAAATPMIARWSPPHNWPSTWRFRQKPLARGIFPTSSFRLHWVRRLFEKGVAGFYGIALSGQGWRVQAGRTMGWPIERKSPGIDKILPSHADRHRLELS